MDYKGFWRIRKGGKEVSGDEEGGEDEQR